MEKSALETNLLTEIFQECFIHELENNDEILIDKQNVILFLRNLLENNIDFYPGKRQLEINDEKVSIDLKSTSLDNSDQLVNDSLPRNIIVTSLHNDLFTTSEIRKEFERLFLSIDDECSFCYISIFKRCSLTFSSPIYAILARIKLNGTPFMGEDLKMFLKNPIRAKNTRSNLEPPENDKCFLISPPASPPVGWEQVLEEPPIVNLELIATLSTKLNQLEPCELIKESSEMPGIIIHPCVDSQEFFEENTNFKRKFMPTKRPVDGC